MALSSIPILLDFEILLAVSLCNDLNAISELLPNLRYLRLQTSSVHSTDDTNFLGSLYSFCASYYIGMEGSTCCVHRAEIDTTLSSTARTTLSATYHHALVSEGVVHITVVSQEPCYICRVYFYQV